MNNEQKTSENPKGHAPLAGVSGSFFRRGEQIWKKKDNGKILLINMKEKGRHYDGDAHIFLRSDQFNQDYATAITEQEFNSLRKKHIDRLRRF